MDEATYRRLDILTKQWTVVVNAQMHFSDMIQKLRQMAATVVLAIYGYSLSVYNSPRAALLDKHHANFSLDWEATAIVALALVFLIGAFVVDRHYYFRMLISSVETGATIEGDADFVAKLGLNISARVKPDQAKRSLSAYYYTGAISGLFLLVFYSHAPMAHYWPFVRRWFLSH